MAGKKGYAATRKRRERATDKRGREAGARSGSLPTGSPGTLNGEAARYLRWLEERNYTPDGLEWRRDALKTFLAWAAERGLETPGDVTKPTLESYQRHLFRYKKANGKPLGVSTQRGRLTVVKSYFAWLVRQDEIAADPASALELPRPVKRLPTEPLSTNQIRTVLNIPDTRDPLGIRDRAILETLYSTGIRRAETAKLEAADLNLERGTLQVRQGKNQKDRVVPIGGSAETWLTRYLEETRPRLQINASEPGLFLTSYGSPFHPDALSAKVSKIMKAAEIGRPGSCHLLRHTCAAHLLEGGADIRQIQRLLGHEKLETTAIYTEVSIKQLKEVHARCHPNGTNPKRDNPEKSG